MGQVMFYHLTRSAPQQLLGILAQKALDGGWRVELRGGDADRLARLDEALWLPDGFLPHGLAGGPHDARQPVLLRHGEAADAPPVNGAACLLLVDSAALDLDELARWARVCVVFDGHDAQQLDAARGLWRRLASAEAEAEYWSEADGRWQRKQ